MVCQVTLGVIAPEPPEAICWDLFLQPLGKAPVAKDLPDPADRHEQASSLGEVPFTYSSYRGSPLKDMTWA